MKLRAIEYHLRQAAHFRALADRLVADPGATRRGQVSVPAVALARAIDHESRAAEYLAAGLRERAGLAQTPGAREQRRRRRRRGVDPRTPADRRGKGRGRKQKYWGKNEHFSKDLP